MGKIFKLTIILIMIPFLCEAKVKENVDLVVFNCRIYTVDSNFSVVEAMAISDGKIIAVGIYNDIISRFSAKMNLDLKGAYVYPGFIDAHSHFSGYALGLQYIDLLGCVSFNEVIGRISSVKKPVGHWIVGRGWDQNLWKEKKFPDNKKLTELFPQNPVMLIRVDGHVVLANKEALRIAAISNDGRFNPGEIQISDGQMTGILSETAADRMRNSVPEPPKDEMTKLLKEAEKRLFHVGLTSVCDAGLDDYQIKLIDDLQKTGQLQIHVYAMITPSDLNHNKFFVFGGYLTDRLSVRSIKIYADGSLGSRTARLKEPYSDSPDQSGIIVTPAESIRELCKIAYANGFQVNTHCIGDSAVHMVLDIYKDFLNGKNDLRWRIEHAQVVDPVDLKYFKEYSIIPSVQATHATSDMLWAPDRLGKKRIKSAYGYKTLLNQNGWLANGTDFPIEDISPVKTFYAAVFRKDLNGNPKNGFLTENALSREEALRSITIWAAKAGFTEKKKGSLEPGKDADFTVLDQDLMKANLEQIKLNKVKYTFCKGKMVLNN